MTTNEATTDAVHVSDRVERIAAQHAKFPMQVSASLQSQGGIKVFLAVSLGVFVVALVAMHLTGYSFHHGH